MTDALSKIMALPRWALDMVLPPRCPLCRSRIIEHGHLCAACWTELDLVADPKCERCGLPFAHASDGLQCGACLAHPPAFDGAVAPALYKDKGRDLVLALKYGRLFAAAPAMARLMAPSVMNKLDGPAVLVPVPLHRWRLLGRRFNQSQLLAQSLASRTGMPLLATALERIKPTPTQGGLNRSGRFRNVRAAFAVKTKKIKEVEGKTVVLVDDVLTTGATAGACAEALKKAGARRVVVAAFARVGEPIPG